MATIKEKVKAYFIDYVAAQKVCNEFNKKHWRGTIVFTGAILGAELGGMWLYTKIKDAIDARNARTVFTNEPSEKKEENKPNMTLEDLFNEFEEDSED